MRVCGWDMRSVPFAAGARLLRGIPAVASEVVKRLANAVERAVLGGTEGAIAALHQMMGWQLLRTENGPRGAEAYYETLDAARDTPSTAQARKAQKGAPGGGDS